jgi:carboxymethylenebutenolidase
MSTHLTLTSSIDGFAFQALHHEAQGPRRGGVVVVQEIFGVDRYVREDAARWAALGFEVLAPSMFDRQAPGFTAEHDPEGVQAGVKNAMANGMDNPISDIQACIDAMKAKGPVFLVGYCYGGTMAWKAAAECSDLAAASSYYGGQVPAMASLSLRCPVICHFGRKDAHIPADAALSAVKSAHPEVDVWIYEQSGHGFNNDGGADSDPEEAKTARSRTLQLFEANGAL